MASFRSTYLLPIADVIVVFPGEGRFGVLYADGVEEIVELLSGSLAPETGVVTSVVEELGDGALLKTADGSLWEIPNYDRYDTGWWLPPYPVLITKNELYMINLKKLKRVWVHRVQ